MGYFKPACTFIFALLQAAALAITPVETTIKVTGTATFNDGRTITMITVAEFVPRRLGEKGVRKLCTSLRDNQIEFHTTDFAATFLMVMPDQAAAARQILKRLVETDKLKITIYEEAK